MVEKTGRPSGHYDLLSSMATDLPLICGWKRPDALRGTMTKIENTGYKIAYIMVEKTGRPSGHYDLNRLLRFVYWQY